MIGPITMDAEYDNDNGIVQPGREPSNTHTYPIDFFDFFMGKWISLIKR